MHMDAVKEIKENPLLKPKIKSSVEWFGLNQDMVAGLDLLKIHTPTEIQVILAHLSHSY